MPNDQRADHDHLRDQPESGDWQEVVARQLATIREMEGPGGNEFYEAAEIGTALSDAGYALVKRPLGADETESR